MGNIPIQHTFQSAVDDRSTNGIIKPSHWNAQHQIIVPPQRLVGRDRVDSGAAEEISLQSGDLEFDGSQRIRLAGTGITPGTYQAATLQVDAKGRVTAIQTGFVAPVAAAYVIPAPDPNVPNGLALTDTPTVEWDFTTPGQAKANLIGAYTEGEVDALLAFYVLKAMDDDLNLNSHDIVGTGNVDIAGFGAFRGGAMGTQFPGEGVYIGIETNGNGNMSIVSEGTYGYFDIGGINEDFKLRFLTEIANGNTTLQALGTLAFLTGGAVSFDKDVSVPDEAYDAAAWNGVLEVPTKNAVRDKIELILGTTLPAAYQPLNANLTEFANTNPSANGLSLISAADYAAMKALLDLEIGTDVQAYNVNLTEWATLNPSANAGSLVTAADYAAMRALLDLEAGTDFNAYSANLAEWSGLNPSANAGSLVTAADYAAMRALLDLEAGTDFYSLANLASTSNGLGSALIGINDAGGYFSGTTIEAALQALGARVADLDAAVVLRGTWAANAGTFPGGGAAQAGDSYIVSTGGTVDGQTFAVGDRIIAITDNASTGTYAANWFKADYTDLVTSVAGKTGVVTLQVADITDMSANGRLLVAATYANMRAQLDLEAGTDFYSISAANAVFQPIDASLTAYAALTTAADKGIYFSGADTPVAFDLVANGRALLGQSYAGMRGLLDLEAGTDFYSVTGADAAFAAIGRALTAGNGLTGGGTLAADRTFDVGAGTGILANANDVAVDKASDANVRASVSNKVVTSDLLESAAAAVALTETSGAVAVDWDTFINGEVTVDQATVISNPTNGQPGTYRSIIVQGNDGTSRTITFGNQFLGTLPTITDCTSSKWYLLTIRCVTSTHFVVGSQVAKT